MAALLLSGCGSDEPFKHVVFADSPEMFTSITALNGSRQAEAITEGVSYYIVFDDEKRNATLTINNFQASPESQGEIITFTDVEWTYEPGSHEKRRIIKADVLHSSSGPGADVTLSDVVIVYTESNEMSAERTSGFYASFVVDGIYKVMSYPFKIYGLGTTTVSDAEDGPAGQNIDYDTEYAISLNPSAMRASIEINGLTLGDETVDLTIGSLKLTLTDVGYDIELGSGNTVVVKNCDLKPVIKSLKASADLREDLALSFEVDMGQKSYSVDACLSPDLNEIR